MAMWQSGVANLISGETGPEISITKFEETVGAADVLNRLSNELLALASTATEIEKVFTSVLCEPDEMDDNQIVEFQKLDVFRQTLEDLSRLTLNFAKQMPQGIDLPKDKLELPMHLAALALRVIHGYRAEAHPSEVAVHLFDYG